MLDRDIQRLHELVAKDLDDDALVLIHNLRDQGRADPELDLYQGLSIYRTRDDLECLRHLTTFVIQNPDHSKRDYALFTCAICLINLGLEDCAIGILENLPVSYPDREKEIAHCSEYIEKQRKALRYVQPILPE